MSKRK